MYNQMDRDPTYLQELSAFISDRYDIAILSMEPAKRGFYGETWKFVSESGCYFAKLDYSVPHQHIYQNSLAIVEYLGGQSVHVHKVVRTKSQELYAVFHGGSLGLFEFVRGQNREDYEISRLFDVLTEIYLIKPDVPAIEKESFQIECLDAVLNDEHMKCFEDHKPVMLRYANRLRQFADRCQGTDDGFVITHGDAGGNVILDGDMFTLVDWDHPKLAPPERDAWFFMNHESHMRLFDETLARKGIPYALRPNRLAFYCYYSYFYYLQEYLLCLRHTEQPALRDKLIQDMREYFTHGWINNPIAAAEKKE